MFLHKQFVALKSLKGEERVCTVVLYSSFSIQVKYYTKFRIQEGVVLWILYSGTMCSQKELFKIFGSGSEMQC